MSQHSPGELAPGAPAVRLRMRRSGWTVSLVVAALLMAIGVRAQSKAYSDGLADRTAYEGWFATLVGPERTGAEYWADQRSDPNPGSCMSADGSLNSPWALGCLEARRRLAPSDARRHSDPQYRLGWNAFQEASALLPLAATPQAPPIATATLKHPVARDTATLAADGQTFMLDGVQGLGAPYTDQLQSYIAANGDSVNCKPRGAPGYYVCVLGDGTDVAKAALVNGAARATSDAPDSYREQEAEAHAAGRGTWASLPPSPQSVPPVARPVPGLAGGSTVPSPVIGNRDNVPGSQNSQPSFTQQRDSSRSTIPTSGQAQDGDGGNGLGVGFIVVAVVAIIIFFVRIQWRQRKRNRALVIARNEINQQATRLRVRRMQTVNEDAYGTVHYEKWVDEKQYFLRTRILPRLSAEGLEDRYQGDVAGQIDVMIEAAAVREPVGANENHSPQFMSNPETYDPRMDPVDYERYCAIQLQTAGWATRPTPASGD